MSELVEIHNLTKSYDKRKEALHDLTLTLPRGRIVGLLGPNGSGKTTLIKLLNGLLVPDGGEILILSAGENVSEERSDHPGAAFLFSGFL